MSEQASSFSDRVLSRVSYQGSASKKSRGWQPVQAHEASASAEGESDAGKAEEVPERKGFMSPLVNFYHHNKNRLQSLQQQLRELGAAGLVSYGLLNTAYYCVAFLFFWFFVANVPSGQGYQAALKELLAVLAMVWAGSQVTKIARITLAVVLAPVIERLAQNLTRRFKFQETYTAYFMLTAACFVLTGVTFGSVLILCAHNII